MLWVKLPVTDRIHPQSNKFATGVENKAAQVTQNLMRGFSQDNPDFLPPEKPTFSNYNNDLTCIYKHFT